MVQFKADHPNFYEEYFDARAIVDSRGGQSGTDSATSSFNKSKDTNTPTLQTVVA